MNKTLKKKQQQNKNTIKTTRIGNQFRNKAQNTKNNKNKHNNK
jgi:hypothetical protein